MRIGVFDSGIGGQAVADSLAHEFPSSDIMSVSDREHVPYGTRTPADILQLTERAIQPLLQSGCDVIVIACNTATAVAIEILRKRYPTQPFIGLEPMLKPAAALTKSGIIAVFATPTTLSSPRYLAAKTEHASAITVLEPDCSSWAGLIEADEMNRDEIETVVEECIENGADMIVLGCTHYHWIKEEIIETAATHAAVLEPTEAIARRIRELLAL